MRISKRDETFRSPAKASFHWFSVFAILIVLSGCAIKLAPDYDKSIIDSLTKANEQTLILFATVSSGVSSATYAKRKETYNTQIGQFEAIAIQIKARPVPRSQIKQILGVGPRISTSPRNLPVLEDAPSLQPVQEIVSILTRMRDEDRKGSLSKKVVGLKSAYELSIDQALTYEKALER